MGTTHPAVWTERINLLLGPIIQPSCLLLLQSCQGAQLRTHVAGYYRNEHPCFRQELLAFPWMWFWVDQSTVCSALMVISGWMLRFTLGHSVITACTRYGELPWGCVHHPCYGSRDVCMNRLIRAQSNPGHSWGPGSSVSVPVFGVLSFSALMIPKHHWSGSHVIGDDYLCHTSYISSSWQWLKKNNANRSTVTAVISVYVIRSHLLILKIGGTNIQ